MKNFSIQEWVSGDIDIESKYYRLLSYLQKSFSRSQKESADVLRDLENKIVDLQNEHMNYSEDLFKKELIYLGKLTVIQVYDSIVRENNKDIIEKLGKQVHW